MAAITLLSAACGWTTWPDEPVRWTSMLSATLWIPKRTASCALTCRPRDFRVIQRRRARSAMDYIHNTTHNAAYLLRLGEAAARDSDPRIALAGRQLVDSAVRLRAYALLYRSQLCLRHGATRSAIFLRQASRQLPASQQFGQSTSAHAASYPGGAPFRLALTRPSSSCYSARDAALVLKTRIPQARHAEGHRGRFSGNRNTQQN